MAMLEFEKNDLGEFILIRFLLNGVLTASSLSTLSPPDPVRENFAHLGVVLSGRGPVWLFGFLVHCYHPTKWVATYDPRLQGAVVVATHTPEITVGTVIPIDKTFDHE